jgi:hypothetical protein
MEVLMNKIKSVLFAAGILLALAFAFGCSSDSPSGPSDGESSPSQKPSSSSAYTPPTQPSSSSEYIPPPPQSSSSVYIPTEKEACNNYWGQAINQIADKCSYISYTTTIIITPAPLPNQTYGYDCSLTQAEINSVVKEVCTESEVCDNYWKQAINEIANQCPRTSYATISISPAPFPNQTYGYDCSLTQAEINSVVKEVCTCDASCVRQVQGSQPAGMGKSTSMCRAVVAQCGTACGEMLKASYTACSNITTW